MKSAIAIVVGFGVLNALVGAMEKPTEKDGPLYRYTYRVGHLLAFNFQYAIRKQFPDYVPPQEQEKQ
jgi:cytosine/uracil/thiamine/allantoin permease